MKTKTSTVWVIAVVLLAGVVGVLWIARDRRAPQPVPHAQPPAAALAPTAAPATHTAAAPPRDPAPGQARALAEPSDTAGGVLAGRVINAARGDGIPNAELTFTGDAGAVTARTRDDGSFELAPGAPGHYILATVSAPGFLPYAPELMHSTVHVMLVNGRAVRGITVLLVPALDYRGSVVDARGAPVAGARVRLVGTPAGEQVIDKLQTEWVSDRDGRFTFHAADDAVLEASRGSARGWARVDGKAAITRQLTIAIAEVAARDATIDGRVVDASGAGVADALVRADPVVKGESTRATAFATTGPDGAFTLAGLDREAYDLTAQSEDHAPAEAAGIKGGTHGVTLTLEAGLVLAGHVIDGNGAPAPAYTLLVFRRNGAARELVLARSIVEPSGRFSVRVTQGEYDLTASAGGWAPSPPTQASAGATDIVLALSAGATLRGVVVASDNQTPIAYARVVRESRGGGASAQPANAGTVTRPDGSFELTGIPPGPFSITVTADGYHQKIEAGMTASDGGSLGPLAIALARLAAGEQPRTELVGIGVTFAADGDALRIDRVMPDGGAALAGIVVGDRVIAIDGLPVAPLGVEGAVARIRGVAGTTVAITLRRGDQAVQLVVERRKMHV